MAEDQSNSIDSANSAILQSNYQITRSFNHQIPVSCGQMAVSTAAATRPPPYDDRFFGHPRGLSTLFFTEMWERFSYYGMRGILLLFLVATIQNGGFGMTDRTGAAIYGLYVGFVYLMALPGGWVADRILGQRSAVFIGGCFIAAGHFSMAIGLVPTFYLGLCLIVLVTGLLMLHVSGLAAELH